MGVNRYLNVRAFQRARDARSGHAERVVRDLSEGEREALSYMAEDFAARGRALRAHLAEGNRSVALLRAQLMIEELGEVLEAMASCDRDRVLHELTDLDYVTAGTAVTYSIPWERWRAAHREVHRANVEKTRVPPDASGRAVKPLGWRAPRVRALR